MYFENINEDSEEAKEFEELMRTINENCGGIRNGDRCENAMEFARCSDHVLESFHLASNALFSVESVDGLKSK